MTPMESHMAIHIRRREFITLIGGAAAAWPLPAHAQRPERMRLIGALTGLADEPFARARATVFIKELQELGLRPDLLWARFHLILVAPMLRS
jgi:hypothetical protein